MAINQCNTQFVPLILEPKILCIVKLMKRRVLLLSNKFLKPSFWPLLTARQLILVLIRILRYFILSQYAYLIHLGFGLAPNFYAHENDS
jgi:hypothetical protein